MAKLCYFQFYPGDWLKDLELRVCSHFARGLLVDLLCAMFEAKHRGRLVKFDGVTALSDIQVVSLSPGGSEAEKLAGLQELLDNGVLKRDGTGVIYSARMIRDEEVRQARAASGSKGGSKTQANFKQINKQTTEQIPEDEYVNEDDSVSGIQEGSGEEKPARKRFMPPTVAEVAAYCRERSNSVDAETFVNFYESKGWKVGNSPMKNWKACVATWEKSCRSGGTSNNCKPKVRYEDVEF